MNSIELKKRWINFFKSHNHFIIPSQSLIPKDDDSILWINSGVATIKNYFTGIEKPPYKSLVNYQKCIRTNDLELVGLTARHHTLFEMLGNFSLGGYFKKEAISLAMKFLLIELKLDINKLYITYFKDDLLTKQLWMENGINENHIIPGDRKTNFWDIGAGPCGPNTEIFYDRGIEYDPKEIGIKLLAEDIENDRYIEIWNIVFSQYNNDMKGNYFPLKDKNIDTGAGFERLLSILQNVPTNYDTNLFANIMNEISILSNKKYVINNYFIKDKKQSEINKNFMIISDHIRTAVLAINDGASPSNIGRGYIIRRLIRRAYRTGIKLGIKGKTFLYKLVNSVSVSLSEYKINVKRVQDIIKIEEEKFAKTIYLGEKLFKKSIRNNTFNEETVFKLFETYGFPIELTKELALEEKLEFNEEKVKKLFKNHQEKSKSMVNKGMNIKFIKLDNITDNITNFIGYNKEETDSNILFLFKDHKPVDVLSGTGLLIAKDTPFYATKGGQSHDVGFIKQGENVARVLDVFLDKYGNHVHFINVIKGELLNNKEAHFEIDHKTRMNLERNHSATHLLYASLISKLGIGIFQLGSDNNQDRLKFDYPFDHLLNENEINKIDFLVNKIIKMDIKREYIITTYKKAKDMNALGLPKILIRGDVRVVKFGDFSLELCGGTHVKRTGNIERFLIIKNESKGSGIYRLEALTSNDTINDYFIKKFEYINDKFNILLNKILEIDHDYEPKISINKIYFKDDLVNEEKKIKRLFHEYKIIKKSNKKVDNKDINLNFEMINNISIYVNLEILNSNNIRSILNTKNDKVNYIMILGVLQKDKLILTITSDNYESNNILKSILKLYNGHGGGNSTFAQGSCKYNKMIKSSIMDIINDI